MYVTRAVLFLIHYWMRASHMLCMSWGFFCPFSTMLVSAGWWSQGVYKCWIFSIDLARNKQESECGTTSWRMAMMGFSCSAPCCNATSNTYLDYCNALFAGVSTSVLNRLQNYKISAAQVLTRSKSRDHITPFLSTLHWLPVRHKIYFKIPPLTLTFKASDEFSPTYLKHLLKCYYSTAKIKICWFWP